MVAVPVIVKGKVSLDRLNKFLKETELLDYFSDALSATRKSPPEGIKAGFRQASFSWDGKITLKIKDQLIFRPNVVNIITGPTGAGKSSMLLALLGEMQLTSLGENCWSGLDRSCGIAYAPQESWLQNDTIRQNIVMGTDGPFDEARYTKVVEQCGLATDMALFEYGDLTMVGERGVSLSGGQKARITLARCVYSSAQILLLDDPLAALDIKTATAIVDDCLGGDLINGRTVLLVTHNVLLASRIAYSLVVIGSDGSVKQEVISQHSRSADDAAGPPNTSEHETRPPISKHHDKSSSTEEVAEGHIGWPAFQLYLSSLSTYPIVFWTLFVGGIALNETTLVCQMWFLGFWSAQYDNHKPSDVSPAYYLGIYSLLLGVSMILFTLYSVVFTLGSLRASFDIHKQLMNAIVGSTLRWLNTTPTSRIMARATQDMRAVDDSIAVGIYRVLQLTLGLGIKFGTIMLFSPAFLIPGLMITVLGGFVGQLFMKAQLPIKRKMSLARAPILGHFLAVITGLASIRAFDLQDSFLRESLERIDIYSGTAITYHNLNRWIACRSDILGGVFTSLLATYLVYIRKENAVTTGFILNTMFGYSMMVLLWVRYFNTVELDGSFSLERILQYINIEQQNNSVKVVAPPAYWPASGHLIVDKLTARYTQDGPPVLQNISFEIKSGERVAVVGRSGSGKSSLILSLLRCILTEGSVKYDGIDTSTLDLDVLRSNITIVPQVPDLLSGTLRYNLDLFGQYDDTVLNGALHSAGLYAQQGHGQEDEGQLTLESTIFSGGSNISVGQRQILALARAIVRQSKLVILDEATSAIDYATDTIIQSTMQNELRGASVLTIAHRLRTIMNFDKIMVLDAGRIVEFDAPRELLQKKDGYLRGLIEESLDKETLYAMVA
ncbi:P-loop containing nucleoside triphosphate hydrolase protein [Mycena amicta]|nr:P-loop containing nucleoside triphosphate hydrolase protein [Mycena amicta]